MAILINTLTQLRMPTYVACITDSVFYYRTVSGRVAQFIGTVLVPEYPMLSRYVLAI